MNKEVSLTFRFQKNLGSLLLHITSSDAMIKIFISYVLIWFSIIYHGPEKAHVNLSFYIHVDK